MGLEVQKLYWGKCCAGQRRGSRSRQGEASDFHLCSTLWKKRGKGRGLDRKNMRASRGLRRQWPGWGSVSSRSYHWEKAAPVPAMLSHWLETAGGSVASALMWFQLRSLQQDIWATHVCGCHLRFMNSGGWLAGPAAKHLRTWVLASAGPGSSPSSVVC